ncbi:DUF6985 domain-containing protein [Gimesia panareensis]|uniref:DUF6985 domain-containing protein n=1 Tax=Gimesia panareensis TaxID=2527978 RepID=UPI00118A2B40|nr:SUKH-4 family immunity protein [Gimesia panareensis]QDU52596.1 hypothetical protein Pan110_49760 [Gimesia panareensis]
MTPTEFEKIWNGSLSSAPAESAQLLNLDQADKDFLIQAGLPTSLYPEFSFERLETGDMEHLDESEEGEGFDEQFHRYRIIGEDGYAMPVLLDEAEEGTVWVLSTDASRLLYLNANVRELAASLIAFARFLESSRTEATVNEFLSEIRNIDSRAALEEAYWSECAFNYLEEETQPAGTADHPLVSQFEHPLLGTLLFNDENQWEGETELFKNLSRCGWNERLVTHFVYSRSNLDDDQEFAPLAKVPASFHYPIKITFASPDNTPPMAAQEKALKYLISDEKRILKLLVNAVKTYVIDTGWWDILQEELEADLPKLEAILREPAGWLSLIRFRQIHISRKIEAGSAVIGFDCNAGWDDEHGLGFQIIEGEVIDIGYGTVGWYF